MILFMLGDKLEQRIDLDAIASYGSGEVKRRFKRRYCIVIYFTKGGSCVAEYESHPYMRADLQRLDEAMSIKERNEKNGEDTFIIRQPRIKRRG